MNGFAAMLPLLVAGAIAMAGCGSATDCPATNVRVIAESGGTQDIPVHLEDGTKAVLHLADAELLRTSGGRCVPVTSSSIYAGMVLDIQVDAWAESYPMQGWPTVVILR